jgi:hypothetical protein
VTDAVDHIRSKQDQTQFIVMASIPLSPTPAVPPRETTAERFRRLAVLWEEETGHLSSMTSASKHPAYQEIIKLGWDVVPLLLRDLEENESHWFVALREITGANPIPPSASGNVPEMVKAWLQWASGHGYQW